MPTTDLLTPLDRVTAFLDKTHGSFIDGQTFPGSKDTTEVFNPSTGQPISRAREIAKSGYRAGYLVDEERLEAVVLAIFRDGQDIRELLYLHLLTG